MVRRLKCGVNCYRRALRIPYVDRVTNEEVLERVNKRDCYLEKYSHRNYGTSVISHVTLPCKTILRWATCLGLDGKVGNENSG